MIEPTYTDNSWQHVRQKAMMQKHNVTDTKLLTSTGRDVPIIHNNTSHYTKRHGKINRVSRQYKNTGDVNQCVSLTETIHVKHTSGSGVNKKHNTCVVSSRRSAMIKT